MPFQKSPNIKSRGAYYTDFHWAKWLSRWAIRHVADKVLDPSYGGGIFLEASLEVFQDLGIKSTQEQVFGVEIDPETHAQTKAYLEAKYGQNQTLIKTDFFELEPSSIPRVSAIVGNPPFVRSQLQNAEQKQQIFKRSLEQNISLSKLSNVWLPFILHSCQFLMPGGRMAFLVPFEVGQAKYAKPLLSFLAKHFKKTHFITFTKPLFADIHQDVVLLLAEHYGEAGKFYLTDITIEALEKVNLETAVGFNPELLEKRGFPYFWLKPSLRESYEQLGQDAKVEPLANLVTLKNGYVTGANQFFHLSRHDIKNWQLSSTFLKKTVYRSGSFEGLSFTQKDWHKAESDGKAGYVLDISADSSRSSTLKTYIQHGELQNFHLNYKCRKRSPWYRLYNLDQADAYLSYMNGERVKLVHNDAKVTAPNSLHHVKVKGGLCIKALCLLWQTSLTQLSTELEGHSLGGGMLKLEPFEAARILVVKKPLDHERYFAQMDSLIRQGHHLDAQTLANHLIKDSLPKSLLDDFQEAALYLQQRRRKLKNPISSYSAG